LIATHSPLAVWRPSLWVFVQRTFAVGLLTVIPILIVNISSPFGSVLEVMIFGIFLALAIVFYTLIFDEHRFWMRVRTVHWELRPTTLRLCDGDDVYDYRLSEITRIRLWLWYRVRVDLVGRRRVNMDYLRDVAGVKAALEHQVKTLKDAPQ